VAFHISMLWQYIHALAMFVIIEAQAAAVRAARGVVCCRRAAPAVSGIGERCAGAGVLADYCRMGVCARSATPSETPALQKLTAPRPWLGELAGHGPPDY
jgi:hypothetical protein